MSGFNVEQKRKKQNSIWMDFVRIAVIIIGLELLWISFLWNLRIMPKGKMMIFGMIPMIICGYFVASSDSWIAGKMQTKIMYLFRVLMLIFFFLMMLFTGRETFIDGCVQIFERYSELFDPTVLLSDIDFVIEDELQLTWVIVPIVFVISMLYTKIQETRKGFLLMAVIQLSPLFALIITNHLPEYHYFVGLPASVIMMLISSFGNRTGVIVKKEVIVCFLMGLLLVGVEVLAPHLNDYRHTNSAQYVRMRNTIKNIEKIDWNRFIDGIQGGEYASQGIGKGNLANIRSFHPSKKKVAKVVVHEYPLDTTYLKSFVASEYSPGQWNPLRETKKKELGDAIKIEVDGWDWSIKETYEIPANKLLNIGGQLYDENVRSLWFKSTEQSIAADTMEIKMLSEDSKKDGFQMIPYFSMIDDEDAVFDLEVFPHVSYLNEMYEFQYFPFNQAEIFFKDEIENTSYEFVDWQDGKIVNANGQNLIETYDERAIQYRQFVYENYTDLPDTLKHVNDLADELRESKIRKKSDWMGLDKEINKIFMTGFRYSRNPGRVPQGKDFIENFMETKQGFCVHFATASTMLYRAMNVPARYVEGYAIPKEAFKKNPHTKQWEAIVTDEMAHAWCETYDDNMGWIPKDHTPGYSNVKTRKQNTNQNRRQETTSKNKEEETTRKNTEVTTVEQVTQKETKKRERLPVKTIRKEKNRFPLPVVLFGGILAVVGALYVQYFVRKRNKEAKFRKKKDNLGIRYMIQELFLVCRIRGIRLRNGTEQETFVKMKEKISELEEEEWAWIYERGLEATFSSKRIDKEEYREMERLINRVKKETWKELNPVKKIFVKLMYAL